MANAIPLLEGTDANGGFLVRDSIGPTLSNAINRESAVAQLAAIRRVNGKRERYSIYAGRPTASFVAEGAAKPVTGAEFTELVADVKKIATTVLYTEEVLEDAQDDPTVLVNADVRASFADLIDSHALGLAAGVNLTTQFNSALRTTSQTVELGTTADALAVAVSAAMGTVEANGYRPNGIILANDARVHLRAQRDTIGRSLYSEGFGREPDGLYGIRLSYSTNLATFAGTAAAGRIVGIVGDFSGAMMLIRKDIEVRASTQATVDVAGTLHHLWQQNKVGVLWEARVGFVAHDLSRRFVAIINAA